MPPIDRFSPLLAQIRAQAAAWSQKSARAQRTTTTRPRARRSANTPDASPSDELMALVAVSVRAIAPEDPQRRRKAFRCYLEAVLARECGIEDTAGDGFQTLAETVLDTMEGEARLRDAVAAAGDVLLANAAR